MKKYLITILALGITASMLFGCASGKGEVSSEKTDTLRWLMVGPGQQKDSKAVWAELNNRINKEIPNTAIEFEIYSIADYSEKWKLIASANEKVDLVWSGWLTDYAGDVERGAYLPLDELIDNYAPKIKEALPKEMLEAAKIDGKIYMIPHNQMQVSGTMGIRTHKELSDKYWNAAEAEKVFVRNKTMTQECYDEIEKYLKNLKDNGELKKGIGVDTFGWIKNKGFNIFASDILKIDAEGENTTVLNAYESPEEYLYYKTMADWYKKGYIRKDILSVQNARQDDGKPDGNIMWYHSLVLKGDEDLESKRYGFPIEIVSLTDKYSANYGLTGTATSISANSVAPQKAIKVLELMNTDKGKDFYNLLVYGLEGTNYKKLSDDRIETNGYSGTTTIDAPYGLWKMAVGNTFLAYETQADIVGYNDYIKKLNSESPVNWMSGFNFDIRSKKQLLNRIDAVVKEYSKSLNSGAAPDFEKTYQEMLAKIKSSGVDEIIAEGQKQIDAFIASKGGAQ